MEKDERCLESQLVKDTSPNTCSLLFLFFLPASCHIHQPCGTALRFPTVMGIAGHAGFHALRWDLRYPPNFRLKNTGTEKGLWLYCFPVKVSTRKNTSRYGILWTEWRYLYMWPRFAMICLHLALSEIGRAFKTSCSAMGTHQFQTHPCSISIVC